MKLLDSPVLFPTDRLVPDHLVLGVQLRLELLCEQRADRLRHRPRTSPPRSHARFPGSPGVRRPLLCVGVVEVPVSATVTGGVRADVIAPIEHLPGRQHPRRLPHRWAPAGPCGPTGPAGSWPGAKSDRSSERFATFEELTALLRIFGFVTAPLTSCGVLTVLRPSWVTAATLVPPSATRSARQATTMAGDGRRNRFLMS